MKTCKNLGVSLLFGLFFLTVSGQSQPHTAQDLEVIHVALPQDQPYMLFSKGIYETGEDMWFKAWLFNRSLLTLSNRSRTLFLRIYDPADSLVWNEKYPTSGGRAEGHVFIGEHWKTGEYRVEGYTQSSFYADSTEAVFPQKIWVVDRIDRPNSKDMRPAQCKDSEAVSDNFDERIDQKIFHAEIVIDSAKVSAGTKTYEPIPTIADFTNEDGFDNLKETIEANYKRVKRDILQLVQKEITRMESDPSLSHLIS